MSSFRLTLTIFTVSLLLGIFAETAESQTAAKCEDPVTGKEYKEHEVWPASDRCMQFYCGYGGVMYHRECKHFTRLECGPGPADPSKPFPDCCPRQPCSSS